MKCPLQQIMKHSEANIIEGPRMDNKGVVDFFQCDEDCAWFDQANKVCSVKVIRSELTDIAKTLNRIAEILDNRP